MDYSKDIISILLRVPEGLSIRKIVRHVYNSHNTLFETADLEEIKRSVTQYLIRNSKTPSSPIERTTERGVYRLNEKSQESRELMLQFREQEDDPVKNVPPTDTSLDMFEGMY